MSEIKFKFWLDWVNDTAVLKKRKKSTSFKSFFSEKSVWLCYYIPRGLTNKGGNDDVWENSKRLFSIYLLGDESVAKSNWL